MFRWTAIATGFVIALFSFSAYAQSNGGEQGDAEKGQGGTESSEDAYIRLSERCLPGSGCYVDSLQRQMAAACAAHGFPDALCKNLANDVGYMHRNYIHGPSVWNVFLVMEDDTPLYQWTLEPKAPDERVRESENQTQYWIYRLDSMWNYKGRRVLSVSGSNGSPAPMILPKNAVW